MANDKCQMIYDQCLSSTNAFPPLAYRMLRVGDAAGIARPGDGLGACVGSVCVSPAPCNDLMYATNCTNCSSLICPWNVGMIGPNPATNFACGFRIDSRMYPSSER